MKGERRRFVGKGNMTLPNFVGKHDFVAARDLTAYFYDSVT